MGLGQVRSPVAAGNANRRHLLAEADQPLGRAFAEFAPRMWPGVPWETFLGFTTSARLTDNTTTGDRAQPFHEIGVGQVPAGPRDGPAPNPDPRAPNNAWGRLSPSVAAVLGHPATMVPDAWKTAPRDQAAMTIANLASDYAAAKGMIDARIRPTRDTTPWAVAIAYTAFSMGPGGARTFFNRFADALAAVPEERRWPALLLELNNRMRAGTLPPGTPGAHGNPYYDAMRTWQKMESARQLAQGTHGDAGFFATGLPNEMDVDDAITAGARGEHPGPIRGVTAEQFRAGNVAATGGMLAVGAAALATGAVVTRERWLPAVRRAARRGRK